MSNNNRELTGKEKRQIKKLITSLCASYDKEYGCLPLVTVRCLVSATPTAVYAATSVNLYFQQSRSCKLYSSRSR